MILWIGQLGQILANVQKGQLYGGPRPLWEGQVEYVEEDDELVVGWRYGQQTVNGTDLEGVREAIEFFEDLEQAILKEDSYLALPED